MLTKSFFIPLLLCLLAIFFSCNSSKKNINFDFILKAYQNKNNLLEGNVFIVLNQETPSLEVLNRSGYDSTIIKSSSSVIDLSASDFNETRGLEFVNSASVINSIDHKLHGHPKILSISKVLYLDCFNIYLVESRYLCGVQCGSESLFVFEVLKDGNQKTKEIILGEY